MKKVYVVLNYVMFKILNLDTLKFLSLKNLQHMLTRESHLTYGTKESYMVLDDVMFKILNLDMLNFLSLKNLQQGPLQDGAIYEAIINGQGEVTTPWSIWSWATCMTHSYCLIYCNPFATS